MITLEDGATLTIRYRDSEIMVQASPHRSGLIVNLIKEALVFDLVAAETETENDDSELALGESTLNAGSVIYT